MDPLSIAASGTTTASRLTKKGNDVYGISASEEYGYSEISPSNSGRKVHEETRKERFMCMKCLTGGHYEHPNGLGIACDFCYGAFLDLDTLKKHSLQCPDAKEGARSYARRDKLREHLRREHKVTELSEIVESTGQFFLNVGRRIEQEQEQEQEGPEEGSLSTSSKAIFHRAGISKAQSEFNDESSGFRHGRSSPVEQIVTPSTPISRSGLESPSSLPSPHDVSPHVHSNPSLYNANAGRPEYITASTRPKIPTGEVSQLNYTLPRTPSPMDVGRSPRSTPPGRNFRWRDPSTAWTSSLDRSMPSSRSLCRNGKIFEGNFTIKEFGGSNDDGFSSDEDSVVQAHGYKDPADDGPTPVIPPCHNDLKRGLHDDNTEENDILGPELDKEAWVEKVRAERRRKRRSSGSVKRVIGQGIGSDSSDADDEDIQSGTFEGANSARRLRRKTATGGRASSIFFDPPPSLDDLEERDRWELLVGFGESDKEVEGGLPTVPIINDGLAESYDRTEPADREGQEHVVVGLDIGFEGVDGDMRPVASVDETQGSLAEMIETISQQLKLKIYNGDLEQEIPENDDLSPGSPPSDISEPSCAASVASLMSVFSENSFSSRSSMSSIASPQEAIDRLVAIFLGDNIIAELFVDALLCMTLERMERNLRRLLKAFAVELGKEATTAGQRKAAGFVRSRARNAAHIICNTLEGKDKKSRLTDDKLLIKDEGDSSGSEDEIETLRQLDEENDSRGQEDDLQQLELFIKTSTAISQLRERLKAFICRSEIVTTPAHVNLEKAEKLVPETSDEGVEGSTAVNARVKHENESVQSNNMIMPPMEALIPEVETSRISWLNQILEGRFLRPAVAEGMTRIEWKCKCGKTIWDDFTELKPGAGRRLGDLLSHQNNSGRKTHKSGLESAIATISDSFRGFRNIITGRKRSPGKGLPLHTRPSNDPTLNSSGQGQGSLGTTPSVDSLWLLLCYSKGRYATRLLQIDLVSQNAACDKSLFKLMRNNYLSMKGRWQRRFSLRILRSIKFVRFEVYKSELVDVRKQDDIPPPSNTDYRYQPAPPELIPPIGENHMLHCFNHPDDAEDEPVCLTRFPKKIKEKLRCSKGAHLGWGLQFVEGWDIKKIWLLAFVFFGIGGLLMGILWARFKHSIQDAFAMSAYMVAFGTITVGTVQAVLVM